MEENRYSTVSQDDSMCYLEYRPPSRQSRASTASSRTTFTREEVTLMNENELDVLCRQVFALCDANGDGYITEDELRVQCGEDDPELLEQLMKTMGADKDGRISFEEFRSGLDIISKHLGVVHSTPDSKEAGQDKVNSHLFKGLCFYENDPTTDEKEEAWLMTMDRIDPEGYISNNNELRSVWMDLLTRDSQLLDRFEAFLANVVEDLGKSHSDVEQIERRMKQVLTNHSKEVSEMDGILDQHLEEAFMQQQAKSQQTSDRLNHQYRDLLAERDRLIASLAEKEQTLQHKLHEKVQTEQELRQERLQLLHLNKSLQDQLCDSYKQLSASQQKLQRLSLYEGEIERQEVLLEGEESVVESSLPFSDYHPENNSLSSNDMVAMSPPPDPPTILPSTFKNFKSPSLAIEVAEALGQSDATPTQSRSQSVTPIPIEEQEKEQLLDNASTDDDLVGVVTDRSTSDKSGYTMVPRDEESPRGSPVTRSSPPVSTPKTLASHQINPSSTPDNLVYDASSFTASTIFPPRRYDNSTRPIAQFAAPSRVFKVVFLGDSGVGKTSLIRRLTSGEFTNPRSTLGLDYSTSVITVGEEKVVFQLWDTAGQEKFQSTTAVYFKRADAFIIVYDVSNRYSFKSIRPWLSLVKATLRTELPVVMIMGNKTDKDQHRAVTKEDGQQMALELRAMFSETSALSGDNVVQAHTMLASLLLERENQDMEEIKRSALRLDKLQQKKKCKC